MNIDDIRGEIARFAINEMIIINQLSNHFTIVFTNIVKLSLS